VLLHELGGGLAGLVGAILVEGVVDVEEQGLEVGDFRGAVVDIDGEGARELEEVEEEGLDEALELEGVVGVGDVPAVEGGAGGGVVALAGGVGGCEVLDAGLFEGYELVGQLWCGLVSREEDILSKVSLGEGVGFEPCNGLRRSSIVRPWALPAAVGLLEIRVSLGGVLVHRGWGLPLQRTCVAVRCG
jgi:hypothetical protein